jgi:hypothetical protein
MITQRFSSIGQISRLVLVIGLGLAATVSAKAAEATYAQRMACTPDAFRLCSSEMPDADAVKSCMIANRTKLSASCLATFPKEIVSR